MPKVNLMLPDKRYQKLRRLFKGAYNKNDREKYARTLKVSPNTIYNYLNKPEELPYIKLLKFAKALDISEEELQGCIRYH